MCSEYRALHIVSVCTVLYTWYSFLFVEWTWKGWSVFHVCVVCGRPTCIILILNWNKERKKERQRDAFYQQRACLWRFASDYDYSGGHMVSTHLIRTPKLVCCRCLDPRIAPQLLYLARAWHPLYATRLRPPLVRCWHRCLFLSSVPRATQVVEKEYSIEAILKELAEIQNQGPKNYCVLGTRHCSFLHQQVLWYDRMVLSRRYIVIQ